MLSCCWSVLLVVVSVRDLLFHCCTQWGVSSVILRRATGSCCRGVDWKLACCREVDWDFSCAFTLTHQSWCRDAGWHVSMPCLALSSLSSLYPWFRAKVASFTSAITVLICGVVMGELVELSRRAGDGTGRFVVASSSFPRQFISRGCCACGIEPKWPPSLRQQTRWTGRRLRVEWVGWIALS